MRKLEYDIKRDILTGCTILSTGGGGDLSFSALIMVMYL